MNLGLGLYQQQHADLLRTARALEAVLAGAWVTGSAGLARGHLLHLSGKLTVHLQMEDSSLYPAFFASAEPGLRSVAAHFKESMGALKADADAFFRRWLRPDAIATDHGEFHAAAHELLGAITARIAAEEAELYPLAERAG